MTDHPILFSGPMVKALLDGRKTQTRRILKPQPDFEPNKSGLRLGFYTCLVTKHGPTIYADTERELASRILAEHRLIKIRPGDRLWVREAHRLTDDGENECVVYEVDEKDIKNHEWGIRKIQEQCNLSDDWAKPHLKKRPSIHMHRWASRMTLTVTDVRIQRLQDICEKDAQAEGLIHDTWEVGISADQTGTGESDLIYQTGWSTDRVSAFKNGVAKTARDGFHALWDGLNADRGFGWDANPWVAAYTFTVHQENIDRMGEAA